MATPEYLIINLDEISKTHLGSSILKASVECSGSDVLTLSIDTGILRKHFACARILSSGTYLIYDEEDKAVGTSHCEYLADFGST